LGDVQQRDKLKLLCACFN